jgi:NAD(P)H dehydrogenase (quinone)
MQKRMGHMRILGCHGCAARGMNMGMNHILLVLGHPAPNRFLHALAEHYQRGALAAGAHVRVLDLAQLTFDPILRDGYAADQPLEPDLVRAQRELVEAAHVVFFFPMWWVAPPALVKGFVDRVFLPGFAFRYPPGGGYPEGLLRGRSARVVATMDSPSWYYRFFRRRALHQAFTEGTLRFSGFGPVHESTVYDLRSLSAAQREAWLGRVERAGTTDARAVLRKSPAAVASLSAGA